jgi:hypothetical protein
VTDSGGWTWKRGAVDGRSPVSAVSRFEIRSAGSWEFFRQPHSKNALATSALLTQEGRMVMSDADYYVSYSLFYNELAVELPSDLLSFSLLILKFDICTLSPCLEM